MCGGAQAGVHAPDKGGVSPLHRNAYDLFRTAERAAAEGSTQVSAVVRADGSLYLVLGHGWTPEALAAHHGARAVYRVQRFHDRVQVDAQAGSERYVLASEPAAVTARRLLTGFPRYRLAETSPAAA